MSTNPQAPLIAQQLGLPVGALRLHLYIGQRVRHADFNGRRVTGLVRGVTVDSERGLMVDIVLDAPIVIPALGPGDRDISLWHQCVPAHEVRPLDERDEQIAELVQALGALLADYDSKVSAGESALIDQARAAIAQATGSAA